MKKWKLIVFLLLFLLTMQACTKKAEKESETGAFTIYYLTTEGTFISQQEYELKAKEQYGQIKEVLEALSATPDSISLQAVLTGEISVLSYEVSDRQLDLHLSRAYLKLEKSTEILTRAAVVKTLVQIPGIDYVCFYIEDELLQDSSGDPVGLMSADTFVQNTDSYLTNYQTADLVLYFPNEDGTALVSEVRGEVHYSVNTSIEKLVVEQLIKGPETKNLQKVIPAASQLGGVSVRDGICYVTFTKEFLKGGYNQSPEITVSAIANSIIKNGKALKVQILIDGAPDATYLNTVDLGQTFEWNESIIEGGES